MKHIAPFLFLVTALLLPLAAADAPTSAPTELRLSEVVQRHVLGGKPLPPFPQTPWPLTLKVDDGSMPYSLFAVVLRELSLRGVSPSLSYGGRVYELNSIEAGHRALPVTIREGSPQELRRFIRSLSRPGLNSVDICFTIEPRVTLTAIMEYIVLSSSYPRVKGYLFAAPQDTPEVHKQ